MILIAKSNYELFLTQFHLGFYQLLYFFWISLCSYLFSELSWAECSCWSYFKHISISSVLNIGVLPFCRSHGNLTVLPTWPEFLRTADFIGVTSARVAKVHHSNCSSHTDLELFWSSGWTEPCYCTVAKKRVSLFPWPLWSEAAKLNHAITQ